MATYTEEEARMVVEGGLDVITSVAARMVVEGGMTGLTTLEASMIGEGKLSGVTEHTAGAGTSRVQSVDSDVEVEY